MMVVGQTVPAAFFCFLATILLIFVSVSSPTWERVSFLNVASPGGQTVHFGAFGHTGMCPQVGYTFDLSQFNFHDSTLAKANILNLTNALILHPIAAALSGIAFFSGLYGMRYHHFGTLLMNLASGFTALLLMITWIIDMVLFGTARTRFRAHDFVANYGNANWLTLVALLALVLAFVTSIFSVSSSYGRKHARLGV